MCLFMQCPIPAEKNYALFYPTYESNTYRDMVASKAVDGNNVDD